MAKKNNKNSKKQPWSIPLKDREDLYNGINPSADFGIGSFVSQGIGYLGGFRTGQGMNEDEARWAAYLGLPYDKTYAPDTKIRFEGDENYSDRQYQGLSKRAKDEVRKKIIPQAKRIKDNYNKEWIQILDTNPDSEYNDATIYHNRQNHLGDLGKFGIREVGESGIYEVGDKYDFPSWVPVPDRNEGTELMIRDTIWSDRANPKLYNKEIIKRKNKFYSGGLKVDMPDFSNVKHKSNLSNKTPLNFGQSLKVGAANAWNNIKTGQVNGLVNTAATAIGGLLAGNNKTGVGSAMQTVGSLASNIPGVGGLIGAGVNLVGGLVNAAFGSNINEEFVNQTEAQARQQSNYLSGASDNASLLSDWSNMTFLGDVNKSDVGSDGWFSNKAGRETNRLNTLIDEANARALASITNTAENIDKQNDLMMLANYSAYGGPIDMKYTGVMSPFGNQFKDGGIFIKPSKRGTFTAAAKKRGMGVQEFASKVLANKENYSSAMVKKANFARNAAKWHDNGGPLDTRMKLLRRLEEKRRRNNYGGGEFGGAGASSIFLESPDDFTLVKDTIWVPYRETFNDAFGRARAAGLDEFMFDNKAYTTELGDNPDNNRAGEERVIEGLLPIERTRQVKNKKANGGQLFTNGVTMIGNGGTHEQNPMEGVPMGIDNQGIPNLVEEGEVIYDDYVFSNRLRVPKEVRQKYKLRGVTFADAAKQLQKESEERPNDNISKNGLEAYMQMLMNEQEMIRAKRNKNRYDYGGRLANYKDGYDWSQFLNTIRSYNKSKIAGNQPDKYAIDKNFSLGKYKTIRELENNPEYKAFTDYVVKNMNDSNVLEYLRALDSGTVGASKLFDSEGKLVSNAADIYTRRRTDGLGGIYHFSGNPLVSDRINAEEEFGHLITDLTDEEKNTIIKGATITPEAEIARAGTIDYNEGKEDKQTKPSEVEPMRNHWLRYAPIVGAGISVFNDLIGGNEPDYTNADLYATAIRGANRQIGYRPIGNYLKYTPFDRDYYINKLNANTAAGRRAVMNTSGGNRAAALAGLLATDYNYGNQLGDLARKAEEYNLAQRQQVEDFNRSTNIFNSEMGTKVDMFNAENAAKQASLYGNLATMRQGIADRNRAEKVANLTNFIQSLGDLGIEMTDRDKLRWLADLGVLSYNPSGDFTKSTKKSNKNSKGKKKGGFTI